MRVDAFREAVIAVHKDNWRLLQAAAESYLNDVATLRLHRRGQVPARPASRRRSLRRLATSAIGAARLAASGSRAGSRRRPTPIARAAGRYLLALAQALMGNRAESDSWRLQSLTPLDVLPDYDENPYLHLGRPAVRRRPSSPTGRRSITGFPRASRRRRTTASAGGGRSPRPPRSTPACSTRRARPWPVSCSASSAPRPSPGAAFGGGPPDGQPEASGPYALDTPRRTTRRSPGWPPASSGSSSPMSSTRSRSTRRSPTIPKTGPGRRGARRPGVDLREPPPVRPGRRVPEAEPRALRRQGQGWKSQQLDQILGAWGQFEAVMTQPAGRGAAVDFRFRNGRRVHFEAHEILCRQAPEGRQEVHRVQARNSSTGSRSTSATSAPAWSP